MHCSSPTESDATDLIGLLLVLATVGLTSIVFDAVLWPTSNAWLDRPLGGWVGFQIGRPPDKLEIVKDLFIHERRFSLPKNLKLLASPNE